MIPLRDLNPTRTRPWVNYALIALNVLCFLYELGLGARLEPFLNAFAFVPARYTMGHAGLVDAAATALLSMFLHGGWGHLLGNMLFLWIFGDNIEDRLGHGRYLVFYLLSGFAATLAQAIAGPYSTIPNIGASGAISGVLGAYVVLFPRARIVTAVILLFFIRLVEIPAIVYLPLWFFMQLFSGVASLRAPDGGGGVAWWAHVGGFVAGQLLLLVLGGWRGRRPSRAEPPHGWS